MAYTSFESVAKAALVLLGKNAKLPPMKANTAKINADISKTYGEYKTAVDALQTKIVNSQSTLSTYMLIWKQYQEILDRSDLGVDKNDPTVKPVLEKVKKMLHDNLNELLKSYGDSIKDLDELDKHTMALGEYKSPTV